MWLLIDNADDALRLSWLDTDKITVQEVKPGKLWRVQFDIPCKQLEYNDGQYSCKQYGKLRPGYCETYPRNVLNSERDPAALAEEREFCPLLDHLAGNQ
jgi:hypothetical protein